MDAGCLGLGSPCWVRPSLTERLSGPKGAAPARRLCPPGRGHAPHRGRSPSARRRCDRPPTIVRHRGSQRKTSLVNQQPSGPAAPYPRGTDGISHHCCCTRGTPNVAAPSSGTRLGQTSPKSSASGARPRLELPRACPAGDASRATPRGTSDERVAGPLHLPAAVASPWMREQGPSLSGMLMLVPCGRVGGPSRHARLRVRSESDGWRLSLSSVRRSSESLMARPAPWPDGRGQRTRVTNRSGALVRDPTTSSDRVPAHAEMRGDPRPDTAGWPLWSPRRRCVRSPCTAPRGRAACA
jgi:hypothetical protein